jgi:hypothetical protein
MVVDINLPPEVEAWYAAQAKERGVSLESLLRDRLIQQAAAAGQLPAFNLPSKKGAVIGSLRRRNIYADR